MIEFPPFQLDTVNQCLWRRRDSGVDERILLPPKAFGVLRYLVEHPRRLVTEEELLEAVWPRTFVEPQAVKKQVFEIRKVLGDDAKTPRYIETLQRRGYQFIAPVRDGSSADFTAPARLTHSRLVGRDRPLTRLRDCLRAAARGHRQIVFVAGEPGIGKTALVDALRHHAAADVPGIRIARGQCIEGYGGVEPYYPMLEALGQLCHGPGGASIVETLASQAPTWLVQFPALVSREHRELLQQEILGATRERMLREIAVALETIASETSLLLVFEDLQWVDHFTVDLISALARHRAPAKLMLVATKRPIDMMPAEHPLKALKQELGVHHLCHDVALEPLSKADVAEYLTKSSRVSLPEGMSELVHRQSGGNPLLMVTALDHLTQRGLIAQENGAWKLMVPLEQIELAVPESLRQIIEAQIARLSMEEQRALEVASVAGNAFSASIAAAAIDVDPEDFEELCESLARRRRVVRSLGLKRLPDASISHCYEFVNALYHEVFYHRQTPGRRAKLHRRISDRLEVLRSGQSSDPGSRLADNVANSPTNTTASTDGGMATAKLMISPLEASAT